MKFTEEEKKQICNLYKKGIGVTEICRTIKSLNNRKSQTLYPILIKEGLYKKKSPNDLRRHKVNDNYFEIIDSEHKAYWLGFLLADGYLIDSGHSKKSFGITLNEYDSYILEELKKDLESTYPVRHYQDIRETYISETAKITMKSEKIFNDLQKHGFTLNKSYNGVVSEFLPENMYWHFIRGYFDGNGGLSIAGDKKYHTYTLDFTGTYEIISWIQNIIGKDNVKLQQRHPDRNNNNFTIKICGDLQVYKICSKIYKDSTIHLKRKFERFLHLCEKYN